MRRKYALSLIIACLGCALIALVGLSRAPQAPVASAAGKTLHTVYLPLVLKNAGCGSGTLVRDGGFEASTTGTLNPYWQITTNIPHTIFDNSLIPAPIPTHSGTWKAWLGADNLLQQTLTQTLTVPAGATSLQIGFWWLVTTADPNPQGFDTTNIQIRNAAGALQETLYHLSDVDQGVAWAQKIVTATQAYANQSIQLAFTTFIDSTFPTSFFIDDVSVTCQ